MQKNKCREVVIILISAYYYYNSLCYEGSKKVRYLFVKENQC